MRGLEDVAVLPGMGCAAAPGSRGQGRRRPEPSSRGAKCRRWPSARAASRGERTYWFWLEPGRDFFFHNLLVGLGLGYAKPYPCSPLATPVFYTIEFHQPSPSFIQANVPLSYPVLSTSCSVQNCDHHSRSVFSSQIEVLHKTSLETIKEM